MDKDVVAFDFDGCMDLIHFIRKYEVNDDKQLLKNLLTDTMINTMNPIDFNTQENQKLIDETIQQGYWRHMRRMKIQDPEEKYKYKINFLRAIALRYFPAISAFKKILQEAKKNGHDEVIVRCASNRQTKGIDKDLCDQNNYLLTADECFKAMFPNNDNLTEITGVKVTYNETRLGDTATERVAHEDTKFAILIDQMHAEAPNPESKERMTYTFMDDRDDILERANKFFSENPYLIPKGVELKMIHTPDYEGTKEQSYESISGTGGRLDEEKRIELVDFMMTEITRHRDYRWRSYNCANGWPQYVDQVAHLIEAIVNKFNEITDRPEKTIAFDNLRRASTIALRDLAGGNKRLRRKAKESLEVLLNEDTPPDLDLDKMEEILETRIRKKQSKIYTRVKTFLGVKSKSKTASLLEKVKGKISETKNQGSTSADENGQNFVTTLSGKQRLGHK